MSANVWRLGGQQLDNIQLCFFDEQLVTANRRKQTEIKDLLKSAANFRG